MDRYSVGTYRSVSRVYDSLTSCIVAICKEHDVALLIEGLLNNDDKGINVEAFNAADDDLIDKLFTP